MDDKTRKRLEEINGKWAGIKDLKPEDIDFIRTQRDMALELERLLKAQIEADQNKIALLKEQLAKSKFGGGE